jgi:hypothetical protein
MSKSGDRRQRKLADYLTNLACSDAESFMREWNKRVSSWLDEIHRRSNLLRGEERSEKRVFGVLEQVNRLLDMCGPEVESLVGLSTRETLVHESCKVFSLAVSPELYRIYNRDQYFGK